MRQCKKAKQTDSERRRNKKTSEKEEQKKGSLPRLEVQE
nr:MAG TPA: hypothetical protein [Bacteriophage sp.]